MSTEKLSPLVNVKRNRIKKHPTKRKNYSSYKNMEAEWKDIFIEIDNMDDIHAKSIIAEKYNINKHTLSVKYKNWIDNNRSLDMIDKRGKHNNLLNETEEKNLYDYIKAVYIDGNLFFDDGCLQITAKKLWDTLYPDIKDAFTASKGWIYYYKKRWGLSTRKADYCRTSVSKDITSDIFIKSYKEAANRVDKKLIFNMDETFWRIINGSMQVIGMIGSENRKVIMGTDNKSGFTAIFIISAAGNFLKPIIIIKGKTNKCLRKTGLDNDNDVFQKFSSNGWINEDIMIFILRMIHTISNGKDSVLILDSYSVHMLDNIKNEAVKLNIQLLFVPNGKTSIHQPLDVGINGPIKAIGKKIHKEILLMDPYKVPTLKDSIKVLIEAKSQIKSEIIIKSFDKACNI